MEIIKELCPELEDHAKGQASAHPSACPSCATSSPSIQRSERLLHLGGGHGPGRRRCRVEEVYRRAAAMDKHDVCNMQYTSGTTGFPKGVMLTHYNVVNNGKAIGDCMDLSTADRMMIQVPMFHCFGMVLAMTASMTHGTTMCPIPAFSPQEGPGLHQPGADHLPSMGCPPCLLPCWATRTLPTPTSATCAPASWRAAPAPSR